MAKPIWKRPNPKRRHAKLTRRQREKARRIARRHGRTQPSLVDNINAAKS